MNSVLFAGGQATERKEAIIPRYRWRDFYPNKRAVTHRLPAGDLRIADSQRVETALKSYCTVGALIVNADRAVDSRRPLEETIANAPSALHLL